MNLILKGHTTRGKEVIELLEMLGGHNINHCCGACITRAYFTNEDGYIESCDSVLNYIYQQYTLEEILELYPYKVGDKVQHKGATSCGSVFEIEKMRWVDNHVEYTVKRLWSNNCHSTFTAKELQPYKEETMEERKYAELRLDVDQYDKLATEVTIDGDKIISPKNYLIGKITKVDNGMLIEFVKKQPQHQDTNTQKLINKACKYLRTHIWETSDADGDPIIESVCNTTKDNFIKDFERFMKDSLL